MQAVWQIRIMGYEAHSPIHLRLQIARIRSYSYTLGPQVGITYILGTLLPSRVSRTTRETTIDEVRARESAPVGACDLPLYDSPRQASFSDGTASSNVDYLVDYSNVSTCSCHVCM